MIDFYVDQASVEQSVEYLETVKLRIFEAVHTGMKEAMDELAKVTVEEMSAAGIQSRSGELAENILQSPKVEENDWTITGRVKAKAKIKRGGATFLADLGSYLDKGIRVPKVESGPFQFASNSAELIWARGHKAFKVPAHQFLRRASESFESPLIEIISERVKEAVGEAI